MLKLKIILLFLFITNEVFANKKKPSKLLLKIHEEGKEEELFKTKMQNEKKEALMKKIRDAKGGFFIGKIKSRIFEHKELNDKNNWMTPNEAVVLCEKDITCAGFTYKGSKFAKDIPVWIYFVTYFPSKVLIQRVSEETLFWTSYRVNRDFVVWKGQPLIHRDFETLKIDSQKREFINKILNGNPEELSKLQWPFANDTLAVSFSTKTESHAKVKQYKSYMVDEHNDIDGTFLTVVNLHNLVAQENVFLAGLPTLCNDCKLHQNDLKLEMFYTEEMDNTISQIECASISEALFENNYIRKRLPVKMNGCIESSQLADWTAVKLLERFDENAKFMGDYIMNENLISTPSSVKGLLDTSNKLDVEIFLPVDLMNDLNKINLSPKIKDLYELAGLNKEKRLKLKLMSSGTGMVSKIVSKNHEWVKSTLLQGSRWWIIFPRDVQIIQCQSVDLGPKAWFSHIFTQISRLKFYGKVPVQTIQNPGEVVYVPSDTSFAFYNVQGPVVEVAETITAIDTLELFNENESFQTSLLKHLTNPEDIQRLKAMKDQIEESNAEGLGVGLTF